MTAEKNLSPENAVEMPNWKERDWLCLCAELAPSLHTEKYLFR